MKKKQIGGRGIVLIALGHVQYGRMAANLAASIRYSDKDVKIHLVHAGNSLNHLSDEHKALFSSFAVCPPEYYAKNGKTVFLKAKTFLYELSPFDETIFIDVDLVWFGKGKHISQLFEQLKDIDFTMQNRGYCELSGEVLNKQYSMWCDINEVKEVYKTTGRFYQLASEFIYFKKTDANKRYFKKVKEVFDNPKVNTVIYAKGKKISDSFAGDIPDELAFDIASAVLEHYPHQVNFVPIYWFATDGKKNDSEIMKNYFGYSIGGSICPPQVLKKYFDMTRFYSKDAGVLHYGIQNKRNYLPERRLI